MKKNKMIQRLAATLLTGAMAVSMMGMNVFAEEIRSIDSVTFTKTVEAEDNTLMPKTAFTFSVVPGAAATGEEGRVIYAGEVDGAGFAAGAETIAFAPEDKENTKSTQIQLDVSKFTKPGIYRYEVTETAGNYDGITYDTKTYNLDVYVVNGTEGNLVIDGATLNDSTTGDKGQGFTNSYATNNLTVKKVITGNQADMKKEFEFTITINGAEGEQYNMENAGKTTPITSGENVTVQLGHNEEVKIYGLSAADTYRVVEEDCSADGYTTTIDSSDEKDGLTATGNVDTGDDTVTYTNEKQVTTPTGIMMNIAPYILMVLAAVVFAVVFLRRRNSFED